MSEQNDPVAESRPHIYLIGLLLLGAVLFSAAAVGGLTLAERMNEPGNGSNPAPSSQLAEE
jgi:hypothetical protein